MFIVQKSCCCCFVAAVILVVCVTAEPPQFPAQFFVTTGITIPLNRGDPVAQSGAVYVDEVEQRMRVDNFWMTSSRSFIADGKSRRAYFIQDGVCITTAIHGVLKMGVPQYAAKDPDGISIRGVPVAHFTSIQGVGESFVYVDYFVRQMNYSAPQPQWVPWRTLTRRSTVRHLPSTHDADHRDWRFYGEPFYDELVHYEGPHDALVAAVESITVTTDFYNFVAMKPDPSVFTVPSFCSPDVPDSFTTMHGVNVMDTHQLLVDMSFRSEQGVNVLEELMREATMDLPSQKPSHSL